ncbi:Sensor kinase CckA [Pontiella desulfatans]|uniref:histidine kinase n=1 Tax=Pontiella desulfatans TaxID=2750659 RepID=A0A6C2UAZ8_PONDE|nr:ATP-binding protein [Pontiella desulfatans]VGO16827.1 Sensor kinase CckA [Pontiella desulfatans]
MPLNSKSLKSKILLILFVASIVSAIATGGLLIFLLKMMGHVSFGDAGITASVSFAIALYMLSVLFLLVLLNILLGKNIIMPAVEREMLENERAMLNEQLHHSQKMEAVGRLAGSIAHDFNNLLTIIDGYSSLIVADPRGEETGQYAKEVIDAARKASFITRKLLSFSQKEKTEPVTLDLNSTLQDTDKMLNRLIGERITLVTKSYHEPIYVKADPVQMGQVLMNLAVNARDAMPNGGRITIKVGSRQVEDGECNKPGKLSAGPYAEISVHDTGVGIDEEIIGKIFEAFFTTKESGKGTGLGLSIVKSIMKENDGFIEVASKVGSGTTFFIYLPVMNLADDIYHKDKLCTGTPEEAPKEKKEPQTSAEPVGGATILLVEDDPMIRTLVAQTLEMQDFTVLLAEEGWEGVKVARQYKGKIDLLFTDVVMPGLGGAELAVAAKELYPEIEVLFMSGYSRSQLVEEGVPADAAVLEKPFTPDKVVAKVRELLS